MWMKTNDGKKDRPLGRHSSIRPDRIEKKPLILGKAPKISRSKISCWLLFAFLFLSQNKRTHEWCRSEKPLRNYPQNNWNKYKQIFFRQTSAAFAYRSILNTQNFSSPSWKLKKKKKKANNNQQRKWKKNAFFKSYIIKKRSQKRIV